MKVLKTIAGLVLLATWLPATSFCLIERVVWLSSGDCCPSNTQSSQDNGPSGEATCCALASATYKADDDQGVKVAAPAVLAADWNFPAVTESPHPPASLVPSASPPELPVSWQFNFRTALPPRAPSFVS